ncbi:polyphosphate--glucose phosphotransferase [Fodinibius saliphilus]|uniref:polyphosphate--glucose phosphotransferase n=1 Tax=Fodinibius saliphilus TaxID=1920650 RepID=UPI001109ACF5|nr:ROK family protein [Fodinibius saliphilus]
MEVLGLDIGSYGIKGCIVDTEKGEIISEYKSTPPLEDSTPHKVLAKVYHLVHKEFEWDGPVGCAFPAPVNNGIVLSAKRIDDSWVDANAEQLLSDITDNIVTVINDTDATGLAEMRFGAGINQNGLTIVLTVGTGIGSSLFMDGNLIPNTELGLLEIDGTIVENHASNKIRKEENLRKKIWAKRLELVLEHFEKVFHPDLFILGGQLSKKTQKTFPYIKINTTFKPAEYQNEASIIGAAMVASNKGNEVFYR